MLFDRNTPDVLKSSRLSEVKGQNSERAAALPGEERLVWVNIRFRQELEPEPGREDDLWVYLVALSRRLKRTCRRVLLRFGFWFYALRIIILILISFLSFKVLKFVWIWIRTSSPSVWTLAAGMEVLCVGRFPIMLRGCSSEALLQVQEC